MQKKTYKIDEREYAVIGAETVVGVGTFPVVDIPLMSDYKWQLDCLKSRLQHPERYAEDEDLPAVIERIRTYLEENRTAGERGGLYREFLRL